MFATLLLGAVSLQPGNILLWLLAGLIAGFLAGMVMRGGGYGILGDIVVGLIGAFLGGLLASLLFNATFGFWGTVIVAFIGACILIAVLRAITGSRYRRRL